MLPVHNHSEYSALDGYSRPAEIADRIEALNLPGAFLTDHGTVAGLQTFAEAMTWRNPKKKEGKRDLFVGYGIEAYQASGSRLVTRNAEDKPFKKGEDSFHLILLAKSPEGYRNLMRISDDAHRSGFYYDPRLDLELLEKYHEGLICTTACMGSLPCKTLMRDGDTKPITDLHKIFRDDFYIEISTYDADDQRELNQWLVQIARERAIPLIYANDAHYAEPDQYDVHEALLCAQYNEYMFAKKRHGNDPDDDTVHHPKCLYIMGEDEVRERLSHLPESAVDEAIGNSDALIEICNFQLEKPTLHLPKFKVWDDFEDSAEMLEALVADGLQERYEITDEVLDRAEFELNAIIDAGLQDYFLIVWDYINYAIRHGVMVGPGRGSVGGSILAYALGITCVDPLKHELQFERFWNPGRAEGLPDIDTDFEQSARQFMIEYAKRKYGVDRVLPISNHIFIRPKSAIDKAAPVLYADPPYGVMVNVKKEIDTTTDAGQTKPWDEMWELLGEWAAKEEKPHPLEEYRERYPQLFDLAECLAGRISTYGVHASAVVISDVDLNDQLPARMASDSDKRKVLVTQAEMKQVEKAGFPKFDFLGLRNLDTMMMAAIYSGEFGDEHILGPKLLTLIEERKKGSIERVDPELRDTLVKIIHFYRSLEYDHLPDSYWANFDNGHTLGLFQIDESRSPRRIAKQLKPRSIEDLAFIVALNRPGPLRDKDENGNSTVDRFLARRNGEMEIAYPHPILEDLLEKTYGDFVYQEQVIAYFRKIGYSLSDADHIRKILGKKLVKEMQDELPRYLEYATQHMPKQTAEAIWHKIEEFSKYSFNKAHAVGYGTITAMTNYPKWKWPLANLMAAITTNPDKISSWINEAKKLGILVLPPDINLSTETISKTEDAVLFGIRDIKGIGVGTAAEVVEKGSYESPEAFLKTEFKNVKANHKKALMNAGCFDGFGYRMQECHVCEGRGKVPAMVPKVKGDGLKRVLVPCEHCEELGWERTDVPDIETRAKQQQDLLGIALDNPQQNLIDLFEEEISALDPITEADTEEEGKVKVPGVVTDVNELTANWPVRKGIPPKWARVTIEWEGTAITFAVFPDTWHGKKALLRPGRLGEFHLETGKRGPKLNKVIPYVVKS